MIFETVIEPRYSETDQMGIIYHANYINWFEIARSKLTAHLGLSVAELETEDILFPVLSVTCQYKKPARLGHNVIISVEVKKYTGVRLVYSYQVMDAQTREVLAIGESQSAVTNRQMIPVSLSKKAPHIHQVFLEFTNPAGENQ